MNILITAGGTSEKIDEVRHLTNHATGSLGKEIAHSLQTIEGIQIYYVYGPSAVLPTGDNLNFYPIHSVRDLEKTMKTLLTTTSFDFVIHSMAVSDYELQAPTNEFALAEGLADLIEAHKPESKEDIRQLIESHLLMLSSEKKTQKKISSQNEKLILVMQKAPKVIASIKKWQADTTLIGFKLLVDVTEEELVAVAKKSLITNHADFILANDLTNINGDKHLGLLVSNHGIDQRFATKKEIAQGLKELISNQKGKEEQLND